MNSKRLLMTAMVVLGFGFTACGGASAEGLGSGEEESGRGAGSGAPIPDPRRPDPGTPGNDAPGGPLTFAGFVIDLIQNQTADDTDAVQLPRGLVDSEDPNAFDELFQ